MRQCKFGSEVEKECTPTREADCGQCKSIETRIKENMIETLEYIIAHKGFCAWDGQSPKRAQEYRCNSCCLILPACRLFPEKHTAEENRDKYKRALYALAHELDLEDR